MRYWKLAAMMAAIGGASPANAQDDLARKFGMREQVEHASLSPDGTKVAIVQAVDGQGSAVIILDLSRAQVRPASIARTSGNPERLSDCRWVSNMRLVCGIYGITRVEHDLTYASRIVAFDADGGRAQTVPVSSGRGVNLFGGSIIDWNPGQEGHVLMMRERLSTDHVRSRIGSSAEGFGVDLVDTTTMRSRSRERPDPNASEYITDGRGTVRITARINRDADGYLTGDRRYFYRSADGGNWQPLSSVGIDRAGFDPHHVDAKRNLAYGLKRVDGRIAAYSMALDGSGSQARIFAHPQVDVDGFVRIGRSGRVIGVTYATETRQVHYLDPDLEALAASLARALPATPLIRIVDSNEDERKLLIWAGSDVAPGSYYLLDRDQNRMEPLLADRPALQDVALAPMRAIRFRAADGTMIPAYLTMPVNRPPSELKAIVMPHGGPGARDEWGFDWLAQYFAARGYAVLQPNFRGSAGYGEAWFQRNGFQDWKTAIGDVNDAGRWLVREGIADPQRLGIVGWSYGGYAALQSAVLDSQLFKAIVAIAPVTDLGRLRASGQGWTNYRLARDFIGNGVHLTTGSPAQNAAAITAPVLMFHGDLDRNVDVAHARLMDARLKAAGKPGELIVYPGLDHYLQDSNARADMLAKAGAFLDRNLAAR